EHIAAGAGDDHNVVIRLQLQSLAKAREVVAQTSLKDARAPLEDDTRSARDIPRIIAAPGTRILLVEDNRTNQVVALGILKRIGLSADAVANGQEALQALEKNTYALVLMDVQMPVMDGLEATRHIRDYHSAVFNHLLPVIAMTAHALKGDRDRCLEAGMNDYVSKPIDPRALVDTLARWLPGAYLQDKATAMARAQEKRPTTAIKLPPVFDKAGVLERLMGDEELARVVFAGFLEDIPHQLLVLKDYLEKDDAVSSERQAHTIKGAAANIGGEALRAVAFEMEKSGKAGDLPAMRARMDELQAQFELLKKALEAEL
ncbi:MAG: response regulator, partial [Chloroflexi bacterium]|nr:response regulator [Chloroflexota bacterium]